MLGKLIKHEWKSTYKVYCILLVILAIITFLGCFSAKTLLPGQQFNHSTGILQGILVVITVIIMMVYVIALASTAILGFVYTGVNYYKSMFSGRGYLTHTLPVKKHEILVSKIFVGSIWLIILILASAVSIIPFVLCLIPSADWAQIWSSLSRLIDSFFHYLAYEMEINTTLLIILYVLMALVSVIASIIILFSSITIGQLFSKAKVLMSIVCYCCIVIVDYIVRGSLLSFAQTFNLRNVQSGGYEVVVKSINGQILTYLGVQIVITLILYFISWRITSKRLNLD